MFSNVLAKNIPNKDFVVRLHLLLAEVLSGHKATYSLQAPFVLSPRASTTENHLYGIAIIDKCGKAVGARKIGLYKGGIPGEVMNNREGRTLSQFGPKLCPRTTDALRPLLQQRLF